MAGEWTGNTVSTLHGLATGSDGASAGPIDPGKALAPVPTVGTGIARDTSGRFIAGNCGNGGRRKGARNRLKETFLSAVADHFAEHGKAALNKLATDDPATYLRIMASFVPREPAKFEELGDLANDEIVELIEQAERHRLVQGMIEAGERKP